VLYNKELGGLKDKVVFLEDKEDKEDEDTWHDNSGVLEGTQLDVFSEETSKKIKVKEPVEY
jgi:hypothetical protein